MQLYKPLVIDSDKFNEGYNLPISEFVEKKPGQGNLTYLSYSHAIRLFHEYFPELAVDCEVNPLTGSYIFEEPDGRGFFLKAFVHNGECRSPSIYFGVLNNSNRPVFHESKLKDRSGEELGPEGNAQVFNKAYYRALTKAIAITTGIGLKLWTGDDLEEDISNKKKELLEKVEALAKEYSQVSGKQVMSVDMSLSSDRLRKLGKEWSQQLKQLKTVSTSPSDQGEGENAALNNDIN